MTAARVAEKEPRRGTEGPYVPVLAHKHNLESFLMDPYLTLCPHGVIVSHDI